MEKNSNVSFGPTWVPVYFSFQLTLCFVKCQCSCLECEDGGTDNRSSHQQDSIWNDAQGVVHCGSHLQICCRYQCQGMIHSFTSSHCLPTIIIKNYTVLNKEKLTMTAKVVLQHLINFKYFMTGFSTGGKYHSCGGQEKCVKKLPDEWHCLLWSYWSNSRHRQNGVRHERSYSGPRRPSA